MGCALTPEQLAAIAVACQRHPLAQLHAFGSVLWPNYRSGRSDIHLLVEFQPCKATTLYKAYFRLLNELREQLNLPRDLVIADAVRNP
jgi:predicted nucleotidyltransferase